MRDFVNLWRDYGLNDEAGTIICSWPKGGHSGSVSVVLVAGRDLGSILSQDDPHAVITLLHGSFVG